MKNAFLLMLCLATTWHTQATDYYIDGISGNDSNSGTSEAAAWQTIANINTTTFQPGDRILFKSGQIWTGTLKPKGSGTTGNPITIGKYGAGANPVIHGNGATNCTVEPGQVKHCTIFLYNQEHWVIRDLEITNYDPSEEGGKSLSQWESDNVTNYVQPVEPPHYTGANSKKCGILVQANNQGELKSLHFINLEVHGVNGLITSKNNGGIFFRVFNFGTDIPTYFNDVLIDSCHIHDVDRTGISNVSEYDNRTLTTNTDWTPNLNYVIRNTTFERTGANALIVRVSDRALVENCFFDYCAIKESGNAAFNFNTDNAVWQFNEFQRTKANMGDFDAGGVDSDYRSKNTIIQYNYVHDNDFGMLVTGGPGIFNDSTVVRYNIFEREGLIARMGADTKFVLRTSGGATNTIYHNNIVYLDASQSDTKIAFHKSWSGSWPDNTEYYNNIIYNLASGSTYVLGSSTNNTFSNNVYFGNTATNTPSDPNAITSDPLLVNPGAGENGYRLQAGSPALGAGLRLASTPDKDYYGNDILAQAAIDIGVEQVTATIGGNAPRIDVSADAYIRGGSAAGSNFGADPSLVVKGSSNESFARKSLLKFDLTQSTGVSSAILYLYGSAQQSMNVDVYALASDSWSESTVTWSNAPAFGSSVADFTVQTVDQWYQIDLTSLVQSELAGDKVLSLGLTDDAVLVKNVNFFSKENVQTEYKPYLSVVESIASKETLNVTIGEDAYVRGGTNAGINYGSENVMVVKDSPTNDTFTRRAYLNFDLPTINGVIESAVLHFSGQIASGSAFDIEVYGTTDSWNESTITWNNAPAAGSLVGAVDISGAGFNAYQLDVTAFVAAEVAGDGSVSFMLGDAEETNSMADLRSKESNIDVPYLEIVYVPTSAARLAYREEAQELLDRVELYPNPVVNEVLHIKSLHPLQQVSIYDLSGNRLLFFDRMESRALSANISALQRGLYLVLSRDNRGTVSRTRIIKY